MDALEMVGLTTAAQPEPVDPLLDPARLGARIDALRSGFAGYQAAVLARNQAYLRAYSPPFSTKLGEHDQWADPILAQDLGHHRDSFNVTRGVVEIWTSLEADTLPSLRFTEPFIPTPVPATDPVEDQRRQETYRAARLAGRQLATIREQVLGTHLRRARLDRHFYRSVRKKNLYGHSWLRITPDLQARTFRARSSIDPSTVYPIWSAWDEDDLDGVLVAYRESAVRASQRFPQAVTLGPDGIRAADANYYIPTPGVGILDADRNYVWVEDYWFVDREFSLDVGDDGSPITSRVINALRVNGHVVQVVEWPGWKQVPYFHNHNEDERDKLGFSDVGTFLPFQDTINRMLSEESDVIHGESRPKFKYRGDRDADLRMDDEGIVYLGQDEDIDQITVHMDVFPTQQHGQALTTLGQRASGLPAVTWGEITQAQNSGRALATAWRATAARATPRTQGNSAALERAYIFMLDCMELYNWDGARDLYNGYRDFELDWPNKEPRDFQEVTLDAINRYNAGLIDLQEAMEKTGIDAPDEMIERVRTEFLDAVLHPDKNQAYLLLQRLKLQIEMEAQQMGAQAAQAQAQLSGAGGLPQQAAAAAQAQTQAAQQAAPTPGPGQQGQAPATQAGQPANAGQAQFSTLVQDGKAFNRIIDKGQLGAG